MMLMKVQEQARAKMEEEELRKMEQDTANIRVNDDQSNESNSQGQRDFG